MAMTVPLRHYDIFWGNFFEVGKKKSVGVPLPPAERPAEIVWLSQQ